VRNGELKLISRAFHWAILALAAAACAREPVKWNEVSYTGPPPPRIVVIRDIATFNGACPVSVRAARAGGKMFAAWWTVRRDSSALLNLAQSADSGRSWSSSVVADSSDHSVRGCARPAPAIAADSASGYVHLAYFAEPASGTGIFFAHSMDGGKTFHSPVPVIYGDNPAFVSVAAYGNRVAVAYDDPNSVQATVGVGLSRTMGHIFEFREVVSSEGTRAKQPTVELHGDTIRLWWSDYSADPRISATRTAYREGLWH
jgi:hypothetical protein